jgi:hypothetical protein
LTNNSRSFFFSFSSSGSLVTETFAKRFAPSISSLIADFGSPLAVFLLKIQNLFFLKKKKFNFYFSFSSAVRFSAFVLGRSVAGGPRALINVGRALVFKPVAPAVAAEVPFSLPLVDAPPLAVAG